MMELSHYLEFIDRIESQIIGRKHCYILHCMGPLNYAGRDDFLCCWVEFVASKLSDFVSDELQVIVFC